MSSTQITVAQFIEQLKKHPPEMLVATRSHCHIDELFEGILDGPQSMKVIKVTDVRSGFNPVEMGGEHHFDVLVIE